jgi:hypothetical protein
MPNPAGLTILSLVSLHRAPHLELDIDAPPVSGQLQLDGSIARDLDCWLELTVLIETIRNTAKRPLTHQDETQEEQRRRALIACWSNRYPRSTADQAFWG